MNSLYYIVKPLMCDNYIIRYGYSVLILITYLSDRLNNNSSYLLLDQKKLIEAIMI
jgi:hypothetical protein